MSEDDEGRPRAVGRTVQGVVEAQLPSGLYRVNVEGTRVTAHVEQGLERNFVRLLVGDDVEVQLAALDGTRGRIVRRIG